MAIECKDRSRSGDVDEMREVLARLFDLTLVTQPGPGKKCRIYEDHSSTTWGRYTSRYRAFFELGAFAIVRVGQFSEGARKLGAHYHVRRCGNVYADDDAIDDLEANFMETLDRIDVIS